MKMLQLGHVEPRPRLTCCIRCGVRMKGNIGSPDVDVRLQLRLGVIV